MAPSPTLPNSEFEFQHFQAPLDDGLCDRLVALLQHKGSPWVEDLRQRVRGELTGSEDHYFLARHHDRLVAHAWYTVSQRAPGLGLIGHVFTHPDVRRQGVSRRLLGLAMDVFQERGGEIMQLFTSTPFSVPFYEQLGFENLFTQTVYHDQDWYMRHPVGAEQQLAGWFQEPDKPQCRPLEAGDLPQYCLLYNVARDMTLKDRAQQVGFGLEAELAFINTLAAVSQRRAVCSVLDNGQTILGTASLLAAEFPHQAHIAMFDTYLCSNACKHLAALADHCLQRRAELGIEKVYAMCVDAIKLDQLQQIGFVSLTTLPRHYRVGTEYFDCQLLEWKE